MSNHPTFDPSIPVLTEVFRDEPAKPGSGPADLTPSSDAEAPGWQALEKRLTERIMQQLQEEIRSSLPRIVAEAVAQEMAQLQTLKK